MDYEQKRTDQNKSGDVEQSQANAGPVPTITLPKGGGAVRGIGEKFAANPVTGTGSLTIPIATSPGRGDFGPQLSLSYDSGAGNGFFGLGWNLSLPSITRKTDKGLPRYFDTDQSDEFILSGAEDLVPVLVESAGEWVREALPPRTVNGEIYQIQRYRPRTEGLFARIERWTNQSNPADSFWRSISKDNITTWYGKSDESRIADPADPAHIFSWLICESYDDNGNVIVYEYKPEDSMGINLFQAHERNRTEASRSTNRHIKRIKYGNQHPYFPSLSDDQPATALPSEWLFEVVLDYGEHDADAPLPADDGAWSVRHDPFSTYRAGFEVRTYRLCQRVLMFHHFPDEEEVGENCPVRSTDFNYRYEQDPADPRNPIHTVLTSVTQCGYRKQADDSYLKKTMPPVEFDYSQAVLGTEIKRVGSDSLENLPYGVDGANYQWVDLDGEGLSGVLTEQGGMWFYKYNESPITRSVENSTARYEARLGPVQSVPSMPSGGLSGVSNRQFLDLAGDGQVDLVELDRPTAGFYERTHEQGWQTFRAFEHVPNIDWNDPNLKFIDLTGDGHADVLITENEAFSWYPSLAEAGFDTAERVPIPTDEEQGPRVVFADSAQTIFQADLSGDGLTDIVRIRNGEACYWPNLGYGRFGARVTMDDAPWFDSPDQFNPRRIHLADIDGSGVTDIIYLGRNKTQLWFNQSGNAWSAAQTLDGFPPVDNSASVAAVDLLGNGTACLVWSTPLLGESQAPMRYIELMAEGKPHLMIGTRNNLGAETRVRYAPSTYFYLKDKQEGKPWITRLPFPVHVVEKVVVTDKWRETRFATTYSYHHGYFDGVEREFRGFGRVEQIDVETYGEFTEGNTDSPFITDEQTLYQPPVKSVTWYHTGVALDREQLLSHYETEYFPNWFEAQNSNQTNVLGDFRENALPQPDLQPNNLSPEEWREAMRACKGMPLRQEIYELDVDALEHGEQKPVKLFSAAYHNCHIRRLQPKGSNPHAVFLVTESEAISYQYELDLRTETLTPDPRIAHSLNLNIDEYGNVLQAAAIVYPRVGRYQDPTLPPGAESLIAQVQTETHLAYTETHYTNDVDDPLDPDNYRLRVPCEVLTYELTGITRDDADNPYFSLNELQRFRLSLQQQSDGEPVAEIAYHQSPDRTTAQKRRVEHVRMLYFDQNLREPLAFGKLNALGLPFETYTLALTDPLLNSVFGDKLTTEVRAELADADKSGYLSGADLASRFTRSDGQYWMRSGIAGFAENAANHFFLPERFTDPFGNITMLEYDARDLFIASSTDPVGNTVTVTQFDYRVLAPREIRDINDNLSEVIFDTLGLPTAVAVKGKGNEADSLSEFSDDLLDLDFDRRIAFFEQTFSEAEARALLGNTTARHVYDFGEQRAADGTITYNHQPASAAAIMRERHIAQPGGKKSPLQVAFEYSDGGGNVLVTKAQAEPETQGGPLRWIANGKTILNNKGNPVKQYEPYFTDSHTFAEPIEVGVTPIIYYDAADRTIRTELPDGSYSHVEFSPWHVTSYDPNDTAFNQDPSKQSDWYKRRTDPAHPKFAEFNSPEHQRAARLALEHADTPATVFLDSLGRDVISVEHNRFKNDAGELQDEKYLTFTKLDAEGKPLWIRDARGNLVMQYITPLKPTRAADEPDPANPENIPTDTVPCYDIAGNLLCQHSMDSGDRWMITDAAGQPFIAWDENENEAGALERRLYHTFYDALRRPLEQRLRINDDPEQVIERLVYGETHPEAETRNLRGQGYQHYDSSGLMSNQSFDFKGNLLKATRQLASDYEASVIHWPENSDPSALKEIYTQNTEYDALDRMIRQENWHLDGRVPAVYEPQYNERGLLVSERLTVRGQVTEAILNIEHDAKGQRTRIQYGNGTSTRTIYDPESFRLVQLRTTRTSPGDVLPTAPSNLSNPNVLQNLYYSYDPVGNITEILDDAYEPVFFNNQQVEARNLYRYDALYRLIEATGRENFSADNAPQTGKIPDLPGQRFPINDQALRNYRQFYRYDEVGNIERMRHVAEQGSWTRNYRYALDSNRLLRTWLGNDEVNAIDYDYDTHGSMLNLDRTPNEYRLHWDTDDMIHYLNLGGGGDAFYNYGADKQRTRKRIEHDGNRVEERLYLGGMERYRRWVGGDLKEEIETHHLFDGEQRVLIVEDVLSTNNSNLDVGILFRYQYGNHLGSVGLELDAGGAIISYEEYHPYGTSAYRVSNKDVKATKKRYRYTGMERDEESGLNYHFGRYYLSWLGRWGSTDPGRLIDGINVFAFVRGNPLKLVDPTGFQSSHSNEPDNWVEDPNNQSSPFYDDLSKPDNFVEVIDDEYDKPTSKTQKEWEARALYVAGIDIKSWNPSKGFKHNKATLLKVYDYYANLYNKNGDLRWAAMAKLAGGEVYRGLKEIVDTAELAQWAGHPLVSLVLPSKLESVEERLLQMQKDIFLDLAWQHQAFIEQGIVALEAAHASGDISNEILTAWRNIASGDEMRVREGNKVLLKREQFEVLQGHYEKIRDMWDFDQFPSMMSNKAKSPIPAGGRPFAEVVTGGDITVFADRWKWITEDMLPAFENLPPKWIDLKSMVNRPLQQLAERPWYLLYGE